MASPDPFDDIIHLEDKFYAAGHQAGTTDGARAGRAEGRALGLEKGYDKFVEAGRLYGKAVVWANRLPPQAQHQQQQQQLPALNSSGSGSSRGPARLEKNLVTLHALVEPETLSTENSDEAVNDFDDRVKRAQGKARVVERQVGEEGGGGGPARNQREEEADDEEGKKNSAKGVEKAAGAGVQF